MKKRCLRASFCFVYFDRKKFGFSLGIRQLQQHNNNNNNNTTKTHCLIKNYIL